MKSISIAFATLLTHSIAVAQTELNCSLPVSPDAHACVDERPVPLDTGNALTKMLQLQEVGIAASGSVSYVVGSDGRMDRRSARIESATRTSIANSFISDINGWRFAPGIRSMRAVAVRMQHEFEIHGIRPAWAGPPVEPVVSTITTSTGLRTVVSYAAVAQQSYPHVDSEVGPTVQRAILERLLSSREYDTSAAICIETSSLQNDRLGELITSLQEIDSRVVSPNDCPPTYGSMFGRVDPTGAPAPADAVDPYWLKIRRMAQWRSDWITVWIDEQRGTGGKNYRCEVQLVEDTWVSSCPLYRYWLS